MLLGRDYEQSWLCRLWVEAGRLSDCRAVIKVLTVSTGTSVADIRRAIVNEYIPLGTEYSSES